MSTPTTKRARVNRKPKPGIYDDVPFAVYQSWPYVNNSALRHAVRSAAHYRHHLDSKRQEDSPVLRFGRLVHAVASDSFEGMLIFGGPEWEHMRATYSRPMQTREWEHRVAKLRKKHGPVEVYTADELDAATIIWQRVLATPEAAALVQDARREVSLVWDDPTTGIRCKARMDIVSPYWIADLKTTYDASTFAQSIERFGYHRQMCFYRRGLAQVGAGGELLPTYLIAAETREPFGVMAAPLSERLLLRGQEQLDVALTRIARALDRGSWEGYASPKEWDLPQGETVTIWIEGEERAW